MNLVVVGMGYVGIPVAALFADKPGFKVTGIQRRSQRSTWKIDYLNQGKSPIEAEEPGLQELIERVVKKGTFHVTDDTEAYREADAIIIAVQTPVDENHEPDYTSLKQVLLDIGKNMKKGVLISIESTVAPGTTNNIVKPLLENTSNLKVNDGFNLVFSPERVMVGRLLHNLTYYDRTVGGITPKCGERGAQFYKNIVHGEIHTTDALTAEVAKVTENTYRDVNIAFANEIALICESLGVDVYQVRKLVNNLPNDPSNPLANPYRNMHFPGSGVGGHCLPKDPWLLKYGLDNFGKIKYSPQIIIQSRALNDYMPKHMIDLFLDALKEKNIEPSETKVAILGFSFLENSDDTRNTPAEPIYYSLIEICKKVSVHDPYVKSFNNIEINNNLSEAIKGKDCIILVTRHKEYFDLTPIELKKALRNTIIIDGRNVFSRNKFIKEGFTFRGVGQPRN